MLVRINKLASATRWLYLAVPKNGDLNLLVQGIPKAELCAAFVDLLHGTGESPARLSRFFEFVEAVGASPKWAFPTYYLLLAHPQTDVFVKPSLMRAFLALIGQPAAWSATPSGMAYAELVQVVTQLRAQLAPYGVQDNIDVHGLVWAAVNQSERKHSHKYDAPTEMAAAPVGVRERGPQYVVTSTQTQSTQEQTPYPLAQCATETGLDEATLSDWLSAIRRKGQAIVYGPPGTGKTFVAQKLALHLAGGDGARIEMVQFHPAYSYEDFIQGIRPKANAQGGIEYPMVDGRFVQFCKAAQTSDKPHVMIVDEINRANISRAFGELMYLLEYRDQALTLASGERFSIPPNVVLLGTMNTADRSIALVDHALRRRFAFLALRPNYELLRRFHAGASVDVDVLVNTLQQMNAHIGDANYHLGPSFFLVSDLATHLPSIWQTEIEPYLEEFFFDKPDVVEQFRWGVIELQIFHRKDHKEGTKNTRLLAKVVKRLTRSERVRR
jgi:hypothetical protein